MERGIGTGGRSGRGGGLAAGTAAPRGRGVGQGLPLPHLAGGRLAAPGSGYRLAGGGGGRGMRAVVVAAAVAFLVSLLCTPWAIRAFSRLRAGQPIRTDGPQTHLPKQGTPTMGGVVFIVAVVVAYIAGHVSLAAYPLPERQIAQVGPSMTALVLLGLFVFCGALGF